MASNINPPIAGFSTSFSAFDTNHNKPQRFVFRNGLRIEEDYDAKAPKVARITDLVGRGQLNERNAPVLTFSAYYEEMLGEPPKSTARFRKCNILYFTDDDEIKVFEPAQKNSGLPQGCIVSKGRFYKPEGGGYYTLDDLNMGETLVLNGRGYKLINCDGFTRKFLTEMGYRLNSPEPEIIDPITEDRKEANVPKSYRKPYIKDYKQVSFYKNHPKRLRFYGYYGEAKTLFEDMKDIALYYELCSGEIKIVEMNCKTQWIDARSETRVILRPTKVPKVVESSLPIGEMADPTLLNLAHDEESVLIGGKYYKVQKLTSHLMDNNPVAGRKKFIDYLTDKDLDLGVVINIFGTNAILIDCDDFTKNYYLSTYDKELKPLSYYVKPEEPKHVLRSNDDFPLVKQDAKLLKFYQNDKCGYDISELKFLSRILNSKDPAEKNRRYLVRWFMEDDTMSIRELQDGRYAIEPKHLRRMRIMKPGSTVGEFGQWYYQPWDLYVGAVISVRGNDYELLEADEYTFDYMERHCDKFPHSNIKAIMSALKRWVPDKQCNINLKFEQRDPQGSGYISYDDFRAVINQELPPSEARKDYPDHVIKTLARYYADEDYIGLRLDDLIAKVKTELYRQKFYDFDDLKLHFSFQDEDHVGYLKPDRIYYVLRSSSLPLDRDLLKSLIYKFPLKDGLANYNDVVEALDWVKNYEGYGTQEPSAININWQRIEKEKNLDRIKYICFLKDLMP